MNDNNPFLSNTTCQLLRRRLGISESSNSAIEGANVTADKLKRIGESRQQDRMITDKRKSLDKAIKYSYQSAFVTKIIENTESAEMTVSTGYVVDPISVGALINPNRITQDYDDKVISIGYEYGFNAGDIFKWDNTGTYWLIYLQDLTELAYFRGDARKCRYQISWLDDNGLKTTIHAAIRGPVETKIANFSKGNASIDIPNSSLNLLIPKNKTTLEKFQRYSKFYLQEDDSRVCWRVEGIDAFSMPGVLEINAIEYYSNEAEDDIAAGIVDGLIVQPINPNSEEIENTIIGETFIKPKKTYEYKFIGELISNWTINSKLPVEITEIDEHTIQVKWTSSYSGQFEISYGLYKKTIVVESLF